MLVAIALINRTYAAQLKSLFLQLRNQIMEELSILADLIIERNEIGGRISSIVGRPAMMGHVGEFIASKIFAVRL